jgi:plastocyanin
VAAAVASAMSGCGTKNRTESSAGVGSGAGTVPGSGTPPTDSPNTTPGPIGATVEVKDISYRPAAVTITTGHAVQWKYDDGDIPHNVNFNTFRSGDPVSSGTYTHTFATAGSYSYHCDVHPNMRGTVTVSG